MLTHLGIDTHTHTHTHAHAHTHTHTHTLFRLHPMESISLNSFVLLEHLAMLLTSTLAINC